jgi:hypothetical protein
LLCLAIALIFGSSSNTCAQSSTATEQAHSQNAGSDLDRLVREKRYPELERELPSSHLTAVERSYFEGILADRTASNGNRSAIRL